MAATQTEKQQNDVNVNSSEKVQPQSDQHLNLRNTLLQNGTEKNSVRGSNSSNSSTSNSSVVVAKTKTSGTKNQGLVEMSQYRQDVAPASASVSVSDPTMNSNSETELNQSSDVTNTYPPVPILDNSGSVSVGGTEGNTLHGHVHGHGYSFPFGTRSNYIPGPGNSPGPIPVPVPPDQPQNTPLPVSVSDGGILQNFGQFGAQGIRHGFPGTKQPMIGPRPTISGAGASTGTSTQQQQQQQQQQRFMASGQSISQPTGPTPTLNQLLQSSNQIHRYPNSTYGHQTMDQAQTPYGHSQGWTQKPLSYTTSQLSSPAPGYRNQTTLTSPYSGGPPSSSPSSYVGVEQQQSSGGRQGQGQGWNSPSVNQHHHPHPPSSPSQTTGGGAGVGTGGGTGPGGGNRQSPQPTGHSPGPGPGPNMPPSPQQPPVSVPVPPLPQLQSQSFPNRPAQPTTPNPHAPDTGDLTGQNSNDSSGGPAPGTPNSQGMRPTPSPTGSTGSRSLSPAVGQQNIPMPPRPSSSQSDGSGPTRMSHSPMSTPGNYQHPHQHQHQHQHQQHLMHNYKTHPSIVSSGGVNVGVSQQVQVPMYNQQYPGTGVPSARAQQYGNVSGSGGPGPAPGGAGGGGTANQGYGPPGSNQQNVNSMSPGSGTGASPVSGSGPRPMPNHVPHSQFPGYQQNWSPATSPTIQTSPNSSTPRPPQYLKQHLQHKIGFGNSTMSAMGAISPGPGGGPQGYVHQHQHMGPPAHHGGMGPPANMPPPGNMAPPSSVSAAATTANTMTTSANQIMSNSLHQQQHHHQQQQQHHHHEGGMPPPSSAPVMSMHTTDNDILENSTSSSIMSTSVSVSVAGGGTGVTSVVTTGPDGTTLDEGSQQSTLSNASAASGEDPQCTTPKSRKNEMGGAGHYSHPATPQSTVPSPGAASMNSLHEEYNDMSSPSWPRTPASPVFNSHVAPPDTYRSKKTDSLGKLYEMDDSPDRRVWLDKLLAFMEERRTPITTCPTISKNPLDLFRLYVYVKERGGFMEVTKNKTWKDIAGMLGIGASSSAAYTLRKHYTKNLLAYECQFDRGGIDPQPIINQVEASSKKKGAKAASVPSPGSSNSQDSFPAPGSSGASMDGYGGFSYPPGPGSTPTSDYNSPPMQRPSSQSNAPSPHAGAGVTNHHGGAATPVSGGGGGGGTTTTPGAPGDNINVSNPFDDVSPSPPPRPTHTNQSQSQSPYPHPPSPYPHPGSGPPRPTGMQQNYGGPGQSGYNTVQYPGSGTSPDQYQSYSANSGYPPATRPMYPPYGPDVDRTYTQGANNLTTATSAPGSGTGTGTSTATGTGTSQCTVTGSATYGINSNQVGVGVGNYAQPRPTYCSPGSGGSGGGGSPSSQPGVGAGVVTGPGAGPVSGPGPGPGPASGPGPAPYPAQQEYYRSEQGPPPVSGPPNPNQMYPGGPPNKTMPPPAPQPKRHPDFAKDQQYPPYGQQRPQLYGWPSPNNSQYRGTYQAQPPASGPSSSQQWNQGNNRSSGPAHNNQAVNNQWEHRYPANSSTQPAGQPGPGPGPGSSPGYQSGSVSVPVQQNQQWTPIATPGIGQSSPLRPPLGPGPRSSFRADGKAFTMTPSPNIKTQNSGGVTSNAYSHPQQPLPKREISFPVDSVEATLPVLYRRKRMCRMDLSNVDAWRIMMCLRSGLLTETTYALDALNVLLFDDSAVPYFGLSQWPGLLDLLLEHFRKSLADMFDSETLHEPDPDLYIPVMASGNGNTSECGDRPTTTTTDIDLGHVTRDDYDPEEKTLVLTNTPNYTQVSRKEQVIKQIDRSEDIFVRDNHKEWDVEGDAAGLSAAFTAAPCDSWQLASIEVTPTKYILPCLQSEFNNISFCKLIDKSNTNTNIIPDQYYAAKSELTVSTSTDNYSISSSELVNVIDTQFKSDKKKRTKTLSDVISRIKKDSSGINILLTQELKEKVKTDSNGMKINEVITEELDLKTSNTNTITIQNQNVKTEVEPEVETEADADGDPDPEPEPEHEQEPEPDADSEDETETTNGSHPPSFLNTNSNSKLTLQIKDVAGTLKRRRMSDYEDECYTKDEASLCLITDTQDTIAKRCICLANILRNLTFIPGNEGEFAKSAVFLSLLGKLLLLYHEHPVRTQKTRNYDREEDADFVDSCSSLQGEQEWWWEFLVHIRENVLVSIANIAGHMDLSQYAEDVARPVLDGLLHWAVCPSAHGQDPFPNVGPTSLLSPQRLALEALCKLCVTDANVDLVIATPPFARLERLCAVLTKHLCRSEDQVLREFSVNLLHYLAAADSAMARVVATQNPCVSLLVAFIEQAEQSALGVANQHGIGALRENPDSMGTSLDMLRRAAGTLLYLAKHPENRPLFMQQEQRLLQLVMSQILDQQVAFVIARVLFHISRTNETSSASANS